MSLAVHEKSEMVGSLSQLDLEPFKFSKIGIIYQINTGYETPHV
jgi:hypothetical protein